MPAVDLAYGIRAGQLITAGGSAVVPEVMAFPLAGTAWADHQWLAHVLLAWLHGLGGWPMLMLARALLCGGIFLCVAVTCRTMGASARTASLLALGAFLVASPTLTLRAQLFAIACFAVTALVLALRSSRPRLAWLVPAISVAWVNFHGTFPLAIALLGVALLEDWRLGRPVRPLVPVAVASLVATLANPWGIGAWVEAIRLPLLPVMRITQEWLVTPAEGLGGWAFYLSLLAVGLLVLRLGWHSRPSGATLPRLPWSLVPRLAWVVGLGAFAVAAHRGLVWWALEAAPFAVLLGRMGAVTEIPTRSPSAATAISNSRLALLNAGITGALVVLLLWSIPLTRPATPLEAGTVEDAYITYAPADLSAAVRAAARPGDRLFVQQVWGSWFELDAPGVPVFVDSRLELYPPATWDDYRAIVAGGSESIAVLRRLGITLAALGPDEDALRARLIAEGGWSVVATGPSGVLLRAPQTAVVTQ